MLHPVTVMSYRFPVAVKPHPRFAGALIAEVGDAARIVGTIGQEVHVYDIDGSMTIYSPDGNGGMVVDIAIPAA